MSLSEESWVKITDLFCNTLTLAVDDFEQADLNDLLTQAQKEDQLGEPKLNSKVGK